MPAAIVALILGDLVLMLDLSNRLFGSYARTPAGAAWRILLIVALCMAFASPLLVLVADPGSATGKALLWPFAFVGVVVCLHFLFPYRAGIRRAGGSDDNDRVTPIAKGVVLRETAVALPDLPGDWEPLRLLIVSDLHCNTEQSLSRLEEAIGALRSTSCDLVVMLGDLGEKAELLPPVVLLLDSLPSRYGTFCVRGNHDCEHGRARIIEELLVAGGITLLDSRCNVLAQINVALLGVEAPWRGDKLPTEQRGEADLSIALSHTPDNFGRLARSGVGLCLAGHTHGGRCRLPILGPMLLPSRRGRFLDKGWYRFGRSLMYITSGLGYFPGRMGQAGEIVLLTIRTDATGR